MVEIKSLLPDLRKLVKDLTEDLLQQGSKIPATAAKLQAEYKQYHDGGRISQSFEEWREDYVEQVAVAWVIACIFVRFIEDNELINEGYIAGEGDRGKLAEGNYTIYFRNIKPYGSDRDYLKHVFEEIGKLPAAAEIFAKDKNPLWAADPSGDAARTIIKFFQETNPELGGLKRSFRTTRVTVSPIVEVYQDLAPQARFLGDLYQDLSEHAQKKYALKQTPEFIQQFILDRTLTRAIDEFGLKNLRLIDPACGSGHFLLGAFDRLFEEWTKPHNFAQCNHNLIVAAQNAFDAIHGVDINPFAIAITRFRLFVAAVQACGINRLNQQTQAWKFNVAVGDSLLRGSRPNAFGTERMRIQERQLTFDFDEKPQFAFEEARAANEILDKGYHVVVGNPPYITVKDKAQNEAYRQHFRQVCHRKFSLGVPFTQRFWELAIRQGERVTPDSEQTSPAAGYIGMITANSFMKREFGKRLIEEFFPKTDLTHIIDTSGAYIPGHGTPTVILFGRARKPVDEKVRAVLGIKGEPNTPEDPTQGKVWQSIICQIDKVDTQDDFTSTTDVTRSTFYSHPWSIGGGGISDVIAIIEDNSPRVLNDEVDVVGILGMTNADEVFISDQQSFLRRGVESDFVRKLHVGDGLRDWSIQSGSYALFPYQDMSELASITNYVGVLRWMWPMRTTLGNRATFGKQTYFAEGLAWWKWHQVTLSRLDNSWTIAYPEVATHNHFCLDQCGDLFKHSAPIIKLKVGAEDTFYCSLLGILNSSTACFWLKQSCHNKGSTVDQHGARQRTDPFEDFYAFNGTRVKQFPLPETLPSDLGARLAHQGSAYSTSLPEVSLRAEFPNNAQVKKVRTTLEAIRAEMIALQEELDWQSYRLYSLLTEELCYQGGDLPELKLGERAFEIVMARQMAKNELETTWFVRHGSTPITELPAHWPEGYRNVVARRIEVIETNKEIALIEKPEYKRRWNTEPWEDQEQQALRNWLLDRLESRRYWPDPKTANAKPQTTAQLADKSSSDHEFMEVAALYKGRADFDLGALVADLVTSESVPFLPILRYKTAGLRKREVWERTWELQRNEDVLVDELTSLPATLESQIRPQIEALGGTEAELQAAIREQVRQHEEKLERLRRSIAVPPKYATADFLKTDYWRMRGKLDVPKERWISYPHCSTESDPSLLVGWAGWNHLEQATALVGYYDARKREGWDAKRLTPLLAGLDQLLPWIHQWHPEIDPEFGETAGQSYQTMLAQDAHELGLTLDEIRAWEPPATTTRTRRARAK